jgi:hypothetical protein
MFARASAVAIAALCLVDGAALAQSPSAEPTILFENVRIFDGKSDALSGGMNVLVSGNTINTISRDPIPTDRRADTRIIAGGGRTLMPGLIDMHWHTMLVRPTVATPLAGDIGYLNLMAGAEATDTLMRGFTTVRDVGGPSFGLKRAIDEGVVPGPGIYPSGAIITITSGHGDFRQSFEVPRSLGATQFRGEQTGAAMIADSPDVRRVRARHDPGAGEGRPGSSTCPGQDARSTDHQHGDRCRDPKGAEEGRYRDPQDRDHARRWNRHCAADQGGDVSVKCWDSITANTGRAQGSPAADTPAFDPIGGVAHTIAAAKPARIIDPCFVRGGVQRPRSQAAARAA